MKGILYTTLFFIITLSILFALAGIVSATACWNYDSSTSCSEDTNCRWRSDGWGTWCEELNCWSYTDQNSCQDAYIPGKNCTWEGGRTNYYCSQLSCWSFSGTNASSCLNNSAGLTCTFQNRCYSIGGTGCWNIQDQGTCLNTTGCEWGECQDQGCWSFTDASSWKRLRITKHDHHPVHDAMGNLEAFERLLKGDRPK